MRLAIRLAGILAVVLVVTLIALDVALPRLARTDAARARLQEVARKATGREIRYAALDFGLMPPRLVVKKPQVKGESEGSPPAFEADGVELKIALAPLMRGAVVIDSLVVEGATVRLVRTSDGIELPREASGAELSADAGLSSSQGGSSEAGEAAAGSPSTERGPQIDDGGRLRVAVRRVDLRDSRLLLEDRTVSPSTTWELGDVAAKASGESMEAPIDFEADGVLRSGGSVQAKGEAKIEGPFRIDFGLQNVALAPLAPYLDEGQRVGGSLTGTVATLGTDGETERVVVDVLLAGGDLAAEELVVQGQMKIRAELEGGLGDASGTFELDATDAKVEYGGAFGKLRGKAATATGRIVTGPDGEIELQDTQIEIKDPDVKVQVERGA